MPMPNSNDRHTLADLRQMQSLPLEIKIRMTERRIRDWVSYWGEDGVYVSFSGGKDSTVLLDICRKLYPNIVAVFSDTGLEFPEIREFVKTKENVVWVKPELTFKKVIEKCGYPCISKEQAEWIHRIRGNSSGAIQKAFYGINLNGTPTRFKISEQWKFMLNAPFDIGAGCCKEMKKKPINKYAKETGRVPIVGTMAAESSLRTSTWLKYGCNAFDNKKATSAPLSFWTDSDIWEYVIAEDEAETVRRIYREYLAGIPVPQICRELEADGITTKRGSVQWRPNAVLGILRNEKYTGNAILGKTFKPDVLSKRRMKNTGQSPMYYAENTHPAIITQEMFDMAQAEMQRRRDEKDTAVGTSRYTSKYPLSGLLVCGTCGHRLRRHVRTVGSGKRVAAWGCTNRISNGRAVCDSHHINEDVLERTIRAAFDGMDDVLDVIEESCAEVLEVDNHAEMEHVQQDIITIQEAVLALHKAQQQGAVSEMDYEIKIASYSQQMDELQERQRELKATAGRFAEVKYWMDTFKEHVHSGEKMDISDAVVLRQLTGRIVVYDDRLEIHLRIGGTLEQKYL